jgi:hypothetical protein
MCAEPFMQVVAKTKASFCKSLEHDLNSLLIFISTQYSCVHARPSLQTKSLSSHGEAEVYCCLSHRTQRPVKKDNPPQVCLCESRSLDFFLIPLAIIGTQPYPWFLEESRSCVECGGFEKYKCSEEMKDNIQVSRINPLFLFSQNATATKVFFCTTGRLFCSGKNIQRGAN